MSRWALLWSLFLQTDAAVAFLPFATAVLLFLSLVAALVQIELALQPGESV